MTLARILITRVDRCCTRVLSFICAAVLVVACGEEGLDPTPFQVPASATDTAREPCLDRNPLRTGLFGDLHVHTALSSDAWNYDVEVRPTQAYGFAFGEPILLPPKDANGRGTREVRIDRPLDFAAVTDHAEFLGEQLLCTDSTSDVYESDVCRAIRASTAPTDSPLGFKITNPFPSRDDEVCGEDGKLCAMATAEGWREIIAAAEEWNDTTSACNRTTFIAYEYSSHRLGSNLHRNVIFRNRIVPARPISYMETQREWELWRLLRDTCNESGTGCDALAILHNSNISNGRMFAVDYPGADNRAAQAARAELRRAIEPVVEVMQHKGDSECRRGVPSILGSDDALCDFEKFENSRDAIFEAIRRREVFGTSGPRILPRFFAGWDDPEGLCDDPELLARADTGRLTDGSSGSDELPRSRWPGLLCRATLPDMVNATHLDSEAKVAIVTGASSGIGEASARCLARAGFRVAIAARRAERLERIAKEISQEGGVALPVATDLCDDAARSALVRRTVDAFGRIDVLVNNAGYSPAAALEQLPMHELLRTFQVNLFAGLQLIGEVTPIMREQGGGRIINMSSLAGSVAAPMAIAYVATKSALESATDCLRLELAPWKIRLSLIIPGFIDTATFDNTRKAAEGLRNDPENPYRQLMFDLDEFAKSSLKGALPPSAVGEVVVKAATARRPRSRYYVPFSAKLQSLFLGYLPDSLLDRLLIKLYKVPAPRAS